MTDSQGNLLVVGRSPVGSAIVNSLESEACKVTFAPAGGAIGQLISKSHAATVILDHTELCDDCLRMLRTIRQTHSVVDLPVMVLTDQNDPEVQVDFFDAQANDVVVTPSGVPPGF